MKTMKFKTLMKKIKDGNAEVSFWDRSYTSAEVVFYGKNGNRKREWVFVTGVDVAQLQ